MNGDSPSAASSSVGALSSDAVVADTAAPAPGTMVESASDARTVNNVMRHEYKVLTDAEKAAMLKIKDLGRELHNYIAALGFSRELDLAKTKIEEAVMWSVKHLTA